MSKNYKSLKPQLLRIIIVIYLITCIAALTLIYYTLNNKIENLGTKFSTQYLLKEKNRISSPINREIALAQKMVDTPILKNWTKSENKPELKKMALAELESYRQHFQDKCYFFIIDKSQNYYFNNKYKYTLDKNNKKDQWYFTTMKNIDDYILNVNVDRELNTTKLWINAIMYDNKGNKIGMAGTGLTLDKFLENFLQSNSSYITPILFDKNGFIQAYKDADYIQLSAISTKLSDQEDKTIFEFLTTKEKQKFKNIMKKLKQNSQKVHTINLKINDNKRIAAVTYIPSLNWYTMILLDSSEIFSIWDFTPTIAILIASLLITVLGIVYFINKIIINPVNRLTNFTEVIADGNYNKNINLNSKNELGHLANSFNEMAGTIHNHTEHLEEMVNRRTSELTETNEKLEAKNKKIMDNISYAQYIQQSILPSKKMFNKCFADHFIIWKPRDTVGGDFYWLKKIDDHLLIAVIDCTGHGVPGALMTMTANAVLNRIVDKDHTKNPSLFLQELNKVLKETLHENNNDLQRDDGLDISLCSINEINGELTFAGAKMSLYYTDNNNIVHLKGDRHSIGYQRSQEDYEFTNHKLDINNKTFYITTDGFLDQHGGENNKRFNRKNFIAMLENNFSNDLKVQRKIYKDKLHDFMGNEEQRDDITLLGFKFT